MAKIWITDGVTNARLDRSEPVPDGWRYGRTLSAQHLQTIRVVASVKHSDERRARSSAAHLSAWSDPKKRANILAGRPPFTWINDGVVSRKLPIGDDMPTGWVTGRPKLPPRRRPSTEELAALRNTGPAIYYVYILFRGDTGAPFYVGKGQGNRWLHHERDAKTGTGPKDRLICKLLANGIPIPKLKVAEGLTSAQAAEKEIALIAELGFGDNGPLLNLTSGGEGVSNLPEAIRKIMGDKSRAHHAANPVVWITDGKVNQKIAVGSDVTEGWTVGRTIDYEHKAAIAATGTTFDNPEHRAKAQAALDLVIAATPPQVWITDGVANRKVDAAAPNLPSGWTFGHTLSSEGRASTAASARLRMTDGRAERQANAAWTNPDSRAALIASRQDQCWITDGTVSRRHSKSEPIPEGWRRGRTGLYGRAAAKAKRDESALL